MSVERFVCRDTVPGSDSAIPEIGLILGVAGTKGLEISIGNLQVPGKVEIDSTTAPPTVRLIDAAAWYGNVYTHKDRTLRLSSANPRLVSVFGTYQGPGSEIEIKTPTP